MTFLKTSPAEIASPHANDVEGERPARSALWPFVAYCVACLCTAGPILMHMHLPLVDLPNHIARHVIIATQSGPLLDYYSASTALVPNSSVDLLWRLTGYPIAAERFSQLVMAGYAVLLIASVMVLSRTLHGRWMAWPAVSGLVVFNLSFFWGFQNFLVALPFCILAMALWLWLEDRPLWLRVVIFVPVAALIYIMHLFAFASIAIMAFGREMQVLFEAGHRFRQAGRGLIMALPFIGPLAWLSYSVSIGGEAPGGNLTQFGDLTERLSTVSASYMAPGSMEVLPLNLIGGVGLFSLFFCFLTLWRRRMGPRLRFALPMKGPAIAMAVTTFLTPAWLNGVALVQIRPPLLLMLILLAATSWQGLSRNQFSRLAVAFLCLLVARGVLFERFAVRHNAEINDLLAVLQAVPAGSRVLPLRSSIVTSDPRLFLAQAYAVSNREAFVPTLFQGVHAIAVEPRWRAYSNINFSTFSGLHECLLVPNACPPGTEVPILVEDWQKKFTHVLLLDTSSRYLDNLSNLTESASVGRFTVYTVDAAP
jgi:hypothetical protein